LHTYEIPEHASRAKYEWRKKTMNSMKPGAILQAAMAMEPEVRTAEKFPDETRPDGV